MNTATRTQRPEELRIFVERLMHFMNLWTIYKDTLSGHYVPSVGKAHVENKDRIEFPVGITMMFVLYSYFYSLVEDSDDGLNGFRVWREVWPSEEVAISAWRQGYCLSWTGSGCFAIALDFMEAERGATKLLDSTCSTNIPGQRFMTRCDYTSRWELHYLGWTLLFTQTIWKTRLVVARGLTT